MEEKTTKGLKEQRERRKRINCMKMGIITSIFVWMLISIILCVVLLCRVISLQNQIDRLVSSGIVSGQVQQDENQSKGEMSTGTELQTDTEYQDQNSCRIGTWSIIKGKIYFKLISRLCLVAFILCHQ